MKCQRLFWSIKLQVQVKSQVTGEYNLSETSSWRFESPSWTIFLFLSMFSNHHKEFLHTTSIKQILFCYKWYQLPRFINSLLWPFLSIFLCFPCCCIHLSFLWELVVSASLWGSVVHKVQMVILHLLFPHRAECMHLWACACIRAH